MCILGFPKLNSNFLSHRILLSFGIILFLFHFTSFLSSWLQQELFLVFEWWWKKNKLDKAKTGAISCIFRALWQRSPFLSSHPKMYFSLSLSSWWKVGTFKVQFIWVITGISLKRIWTALYKCLFHPLPLKRNEEHRWDLDFDFLNIYLLVRWIPTYIPDLTVIIVPMYLNEIRASDCRYSLWE